MNDEVGAASGGTSIGGTSPGGAGRLLTLLAGLAWIALLAASVLPALPGYVAGPLFVLLALAALHGPGLLRPAERGSPDPGHRLAALSRDAWASGLLGGYLFVVAPLGAADAGIEAIGRRMALGLLPVLAGAALASFAAIRAAAARRAGDVPDAGAAPPSPARWLGPSLLALLVAVTLWSSSRLAGEAQLSTVSLLLHPPALLVVAGGSLLLIRAAGKGTAARLLAPALALAGTFAAAAGLVQALLGFAARDLARVTAGIAFLLSSGFSALLAMLLLARPAPAAGRPAGGPAVLLAWTLFPLVALLFLVLALVLAMTPMTRTA